MASELIVPSDKLGQSGDGIKLGQWYWVRKAKPSEVSDEHDDGEGGWLGCITEIGTNYVEVQSPPRDGGYSSIRVHMNNFHKRLRREFNADAVIARNAAAHKAKIEETLGKIREITKRLGVAPTTMIEDVEAMASSMDAPGTSLAVMSSSPDIKKYENELKRTHKVTLPKLFDEIKTESKSLNSWMLASTLPMKAQNNLLKGSIAGIEEQIFNVSLYAGLTEDVVECSKGEPAAMTDKLHVMQRRLYMDEECLLNYEAGGMEFKHLSKFDEWIARPENRDRILPYPRTVVAMKVRRKKKDREVYDLGSAYIAFNLGELEKMTFLYIRNGDQVWRLSCAEDFGAMIFPNHDAFTTEAALMMCRHFGDIDFMPVAKYEFLVEREKERKRLSDAWLKDNKAKRKGERQHEHNNPHRETYDRLGDYEKFNSDSVYFDDANRQITAEVKSYNRIVLILQGLLDRSPVLHPHPPINLWRADHAERHVTMVYDATNVLYSGDKPDFEAYRAKLNALITTDCYLTGQDSFWEQREAEKENQRARNDWRSRDRYYERTTFRPYGNPGPGIVSKPVAYNPRKKAARFEWTREPMRWSPGKGRIPATITVPSSRLLNVSAYTPGDYKQFFHDPRTREQYLTWAPLMLAAEDHHAGKTKRSHDDD